MLPSPEVLGSCWEDPKSHLFRLNKSCSLSLQAKQSRTWPAWWPSPGLVPFYQCLSYIGRILKVDSVLQIWSNKHWIEGDNPFPPSTGHAFIDTSQDAASSLCWQGTLLAHAQLTVCQDPRAFSIELLSSQSFIIYLSTLPDCKIPTCKQKYCGKQCFMIELFVVKAKNTAEGLWICYFQQIQFSITL